MTPTTRNERGRFNLFFLCVIGFSIGMATGSVWWGLAATSTCALAINNLAFWLDRAFPETE